MSHLLSFSYVDDDEVVGTLFRDLSVDDNSAKKNWSSMTSFKDAQVVEKGQSARWGQVVKLVQNKN